jgi:hypothetical protein
MRVLVKRQKEILCLAIWLVVSLIVLAGSFRFNSDDWWWTATYTALIVFATSYTALMYTSQLGSSNTGKQKPTELEA